MKRFRFVLSAVLLTLCAVACAQSPGKPASVSDAQKTFDTMKSLAGTWQGSITTDDPVMSTDKPLPLSIRVGSQGNALIHELNTGNPEVTMIYVENDRLTLLHYCDFGNRPLMFAQPLPDGKTIDFELSAFSGSNQIGHVSRGVFTIIDPNHHVEDWTFMWANGKSVHAHIDFKRVQ